LKYISNSKINLGLKILNKRDDNFHNLESLFIELKFHDILIFEKSKNFKISSNVKEVPTDNNNLIYKSYQILKKICKPSIEYSIHIEKNIPIGSGLGGGSSNAAKTLCVLNKLWSANLSNNELINISKGIGSDVPFFINGSTQLVKGKGDILTKVDGNFIKDYTILLVFPRFSVNTKWAFTELSKQKKYLFDNNTINKFPTLSKTLDWKFFKNDFEEMINQAYPEIGIIKSKLINLGACYSSLSGSGSTMFGVFEDYKKAVCASKSISKYVTAITEPHII
tara:strand:- start:71 stop:910 length:840 start_codon:yes stop_codon:yes gene_type:complete